MTNENNDIKDETNNADSTTDNDCLFDDARPRTATEQALLETRPFGTSIARRPDHPYWPSEPH